MLPVIPHFANECITLLKEDEKIKWPDIDQNILTEEVINYVIQINGKKRGLIKASRNIQKKIY